MELSKGELLNALRYWRYMDFLEQDKIPDSTYHPYTNKQGKYTSIHLCFELSSEDDGESLDKSLDEVFRSKLSEGCQDFGLSERYLFIGSVEREFVVQYLAGKIENIKGLNPDKETERIAALLVKFDNAGNFKSLQISPVLFAATQFQPGTFSDASLSSLEDEEKKLGSSFSKKIGQNCNEIQLSKVHGWACNKVKKLLSPLVNSGAMDEEALEEACSFMCADFWAYRDAEGRNEHRRSLGLSYYSDDIESLIKAAEGARTINDLKEGRLAPLINYISAGCDGETTRNDRLDLLDGGSNRDELVDFFQKVLSPNSTPVGKWPSRYPLALMQQTAVNLAVGRNREEINAGDMISVNGPPGTGKTTLLKDIVAAMTIERARALAKYDSPDDAFEAIEGFPSNCQRPEGYYCQYARKVYQLKNDAINDYGILVCSSNNKAVENISAELPSIPGITEGLKADDENDGEFVKSELNRALKLYEELEYFNDAAAKQFKKRARSEDGDLEAPNEESSTGAKFLVSARLGKRDNVDKFTECLYEVIRAIKHDRRCPKGKKPPKLDRYNEAKQAFLEQYERAEGALSELGAQVSCHETIAKNIEAFQSNEQKVKAKYAALGEIHQDGASSILKSIKDRVGDKKRQGLLKNLEVSAKLIKDEESKLRLCNERLEEMRRGCEADRGRYTNAKDAAKALLSDPLPDQKETREEAQLSNPASSFLADRQRDKLLYYAIEFMKEFVLASRCMRSNIENLRAILGAKVACNPANERKRVCFSEEDRLLISEPLFQTLFLLTPVISTTFASVGKMFRDVPVYKDLGKAPFGLLIIDEAGQAVPHAALGAIARCRRSVVVGDPKQVEPVVTSDLDILRSTWSKTVGSILTSKMTSVQTLADRQNRYGSYLGAGPEDEKSCWAGCPLLVHRRCQSPMFDISNKISYNEMMLQETSGDPFDEIGNASSEESYSLPVSMWINVVGSENGKKDHFVERQGEKALGIVAKAFKAAGGQVPDLFIISPFATVASGMRSLCKKELEEAGIADETLKKFCKDNIGTVHSFQGKEAAEVIFMLGCDGEAMGAVRWVNSNIVNVAASRAKKRLYVIGDFAVWENNCEVKDMKSIMDKWLFDECESLLKSLSMEEGHEEARNKLRAMIPNASLLEELGVITDAAQAEDDETEIDEDNFLENATALASGEALSVDQLKAFGLPTSKQEMVKYYENLVGEEEAKKEIAEQIAGLVMQGLSIYYLFGIGEDEATEENIDVSFCFLNFCKAAELLLKSAYYPRLKRAAPYFAIKSNGQETLETIKPNRLTINTMMNIIKSNRFMLGELAYPDRDEEWWRQFAKHLEDFGKLRNSVCHGGNRDQVGIEKCRNATKSIFNGSKKDGSSEERKGVLLESDAVRLLDEALSDAERLEAARAKQDKRNTAPDAPVAFEDVKKVDRKKDGYCSMTKIIQKIKEGAQDDGPTLQVQAINKNMESRNFIVHMTGAPENIAPNGKTVDWLPTKKGEEELGIALQEGDTYYGLVYPESKQDDIRNLVQDLFNE